MIDLSILQCIDCAARIVPADDGLFECQGCLRQYPTTDGILYAMGLLQSNNSIAAKFYDGRWWKRYRQRERLALALMGGERRFRRNLFRLLPDLKGSRLLDIGIGDGANMPYIDAQCQVVGVDISPVQLQECYLRYPDRLLDLVLAEAEHLPFQQRAFDNAVTIGAFNLFNSRRSAVLEMLRIVKPGGTILIVDEVPAFVGVLPGHRIGLPGLDRWLLANAVGVGSDFAALLQAHQHADVFSEARELLLNVSLRYFFARTCYCLLGTVP